jgi:hypothetical protein
MKTENPKEFLQITQTVESILNIENLEDKMIALRGITKIWGPKDFETAFYYMMGRYSGLKHTLTIKEKP